MSKRRPVGEWHERAVATRRRKSEEKILEAAAQLLEGHGYDDTTVEMIADRAGVGVATVYNRFENKAGLVSALFQRLQPLADEGEPEGLLTSQRLEGRLRALATALKDHPSLAAGLHRALLERPSLPLDALTEPLAATIRGGQARGDLRAELDADEVAALAVTMLLVRVISRAEDAATSAAQVADLLVWGVAGNPTAAEGAPTV